MCKNTTARLLERLGKATCNFWAVQVISEALEAKGYQKLMESDVWDVKHGGKYYLTKNGSAIFAFHVGMRSPSESGFNIIAAHSDSPCFKIKPSPEIIGDGGSVKLNVEKYGGGILYTWFDRPLSISGRVIVRGETARKPKTMLVDFRRAVATIPHLAIHFNRAVNEGNPLSVQKDLLPVVGCFSKEKLEDFNREGGLVKWMLARELNIDWKDILSYELCLYPLEEPRLIGLDSQFIQSGRIDDLSMAFAALEALERTSDENPSATSVMAIFDNEETGSGTKQGAASPVLKNALCRIASALGDGNPDPLCRALAHTFLVSADDAHAWHPNYGEKQDPTNHPVVGGGPVVKINANCKYMTDAEGHAVFAALCEEAGVPCQIFVNHSDVAGGSTLGNILTSQLDIPGVDMGQAIWAMHSAAETAGADDYESCVKVFEVFYRS